MCVVLRPNEEVFFLSLLLKFWNLAVSVQLSICTYAKNHFGVGDFLIKLCIREHREVLSFFGLKSFSRISKEKNTVVIMSKEGEVLSSSWPQINVFQKHGL